MFSKASSSGLHTPMSRYFDLACVRGFNSASQLQQQHSETMKLNSAVLMAFVPVAVLFSGCTSYDVGPVSVRDVNEYTNVAKNAGVTIAADLLSDPEKIKESFDVNLTEKDFYPVQIVIKNDKDGRVLLTKDSIELSDAAGNIYRPINVAVMSDEFEHNKMAYALLGFGIFSYMSADDANKKMAADWASKEMASEVIVNPSRRSAGFIYLKMPVGVKPNGMTLDLKVDELEAKSTLDFKVRL
jgi:hypothetical protein